MNKSFEELGVSELIRKAIEELGFKNPMPVQETVIPYLLEAGTGDVVALAQTGTGKTAAFGIPIIQNTDIANAVPQALILSPTRELCMQIAGDLNDFSKYMEGIHVIPMYGGTSVENQIRNLRRGAHILVATPGRLLDLINRGAVSLSTIRTVVLDEADEMLDMGFSEDLEAILAQVPHERKMLMFSATMSKDIEKIANQYLHNAQQYVIGSRNEGAENVDHVYYMVHAKDKYLALKRIVDYYPDIYAIIFCRTKLETQEIADKLIQDGYNSDSLHGDLSQAQRDLTMNKFRRHQIQILVATDVAARGLDVDNLTHVINYGLPDDTENYTHRSGRTGRAGKTGTSVSIINLREKGKVRIIEKAIGKQFSVGVMPTGQQICEKQLLKVIDELENTVIEEEQIAKFLPEVFRKFDWLDKEDIVKRVVMREFGRFMNYYANAPEIEEVKGSVKERPDKLQKRERSRDPESGYARLFINVGKLDDVHTSQIIELINKRLHGPRIDIGRIDLMRTFSFFEVPEEVAQDVIGALSGCVMKGRKINVEIAEASQSAGQDSGTPERPKKEKRSNKRDESPKKERAQKERAPKERVVEDWDDDLFWQELEQPKKKGRGEHSVNSERPKKPSRKEVPVKAVKKKSDKRAENKPAVKSEKKQSDRKADKKKERRGPQRAPEVYSGDSKPKSNKKYDWREFFD